ncbi:MAG: hypothetical protein COW42_10310, partial [Deltaproteobacteria bacterium CG17_big_fil_post_rev_8_21_14_2_50_63_7]
RFGGGGQGEGAEMRLRRLILQALALLSASCESQHARGFADAFAKDSVPEVCTACAAADATEEAADLTETEDVATTAPDGAQDTTAIAAPGLTIGLVADMRYFAAPDNARPSLRSRLRSPFRSNPSPFLLRPMVGRRRWPRARFRCGSTATVGR